MNILFPEMQSRLGNLCFLLGFSTTLYYWVKIIFFSEKQFHFYGFLGFLSVNILLTIQLVSRWVESGHFPLSTLYESLLFLCWSITCIYLIIENFTKTEFLGILIAPFVLCILAFTSFSLPTELQATKPLVPALQSNWLFMHVSVMMLSYAALFIGSLLALAYLVMYFVLQNRSFFNIQYTRESSSREFAQTESAAISVPLQVEISLEKQTQNSLVREKQSTFKHFLHTFDNLSYRTIGIGFCFLTLGILSGAVWANETWGTYWSWDPKETWALITWLTFATYLHTRFVYGWQGMKSASIACFGFILVWICYLGVNLLGKGLHSYGFFQ